MPPFGVSVIDYLRTNAASLAATGAVTAAGAATVVVGGKAAVTTVCLAGGGLFAAFVGHEIAKATFNGLGTVWRGVKQSFKQPSPIVQSDVPGMRQAS